MRTEAEAWQEACRRLEALGERLVDDDFPGAPEDRADGFAHLAEQALCWIGWSVFHADARRPFFQRQNDLITQWGGPNADNVYRHALVDPRRRYRIRGHMHSCEDFILALRAGFMHQPVWGTLHEVSASDLGIGAGDEFELSVGDGGDIPLPDGALTVSIREYYFDWQEDEPATFTIECLDDDAGAPAERLTGAALAARLDEAITGVEHSIEFWNTYMRERRSEHPANAFAPTLKLAKGLDAARYVFCFWDLGPEEALVVDTGIPQSRYWSFQLYELAWFELVDIAERQTSLNHTQATVDPDGRVRLVVAHDDPGVANWLDTGGRRNGLLMLRWFWPTGEDPVPETTVVTRAAVTALLPPDTPAVGPVAREEAMRRRRRHLAWRFRT